MIPKKFHMIWLSDKKPFLNAEQINNISTWMKFNPDYELYIWDNVIYDDDYILKHYEAKKFAAVSDFIRLKILYEHGGIYLDDDVTCFKSFDPLLSNKCFMGTDHATEEVTVINNAIIGAEPNHPFIKELIDAAEIKFKNDICDFPFGYVIVDCLKSRGFKRGWWNLSDDGAKIQEFGDVTIYTGDFFYPYYGYCKQTKNTYMRHHYKLRWHDKK